MAKLFQKRDMVKGDKQADIGLKPERPFQILGITTEVTLGDLLTNVVFLSTLANQFDYARLHVKFRDVRPYSRDVMSLSPWIDLAEPLPDEWPKIVRKFKPNVEPRRYPEVGRLNGGGAYYYDMVVTNQMARATTLHALPNPVPLRLPPLREKELRDRLVALGLRPSSWFAVIHYRESTYKFRLRSGERDSSPEAFDALVDHIIAMGGQAVRLGHPGLTSFRPRAGFVDLSREPDSFMLQAAAVSCCRFMIMGPSGPTSLAMGFGVPSAFVDAVDNGCVWGDQVNMLTHTVVTPSGEELRNESLRQAGLLDTHRLRDALQADPRYKIRKANADELRQIAELLFEKSRDCKTWRPPAPAPDGPKPNRITWPLRPTYPMNWIDIHNPKTQDALSFRNA